RHRLHGAGVGKVPGQLGAVTLGQGEARRVVVEGGDARALQRQKLHRELADEADADDGDDVAQRRLKIAYRMHRDGGERGEARLLVADIVRDGRREAARDEIELGMVGEAGAGDGDALPDAEGAFEPGADGDDLAGGRVAEGQRLVEPRQHGAEGRGDAVA